VGLLILKRKNGGLCQLRLEGRRARSRRKDCTGGRAARPTDGGDGSGGTREVDLSPEQASAFKAALVVRRVSSLLRPDAPPQSSAPLASPFLKDALDFMLARVCRWPRRRGRPDPRRNAGTFSFCLLVLENAHPVWCSAQGRWIPSRIKRTQHRTKSFAAARLSEAWARTAEGAGSD
jgi:hypothetical protein